ncbi:BhlA/UviB family holin-like peptide [Cohnella luojiensis]|nr:BhlA/UviB family holin-like peptide [Cohnella luojiensis]
MIEDLVVREAFEQGVWAVLFVSLYLHHLKENKCSRLEALEREEKLMLYIEDMSEQFENLTKQYEDLSKDVGDIKRHVRRHREVQRRRGQTY